MKKPRVTEEELKEFRINEKAYIKQCRKDIEWAREHYKKKKAKRW